MRTAATLLSVFLFLGPGCVEFFGSGETGQDPVRVPVSQIGDLVEYESRSQESDAWSRAASYRIVGQSQMPNHKGRLVNAIEIEITRTHQHVHENGQTYDVDSVTNVFVEPSTRQPMRIDWRFDTDMQTVRHASTMSQYDAFHRANVGLPGIEIQGQELLVGGPLAKYAELEPSPIAGSVSGGGGGAFSIQGRYVSTDYHTRSDWEWKGEVQSFRWPETRTGVLGQRLIDGSEAIGVIKTTYDRDDSPVGNWTEWYVGQSPYPRLIESAWRVEAKWYRAEWRPSHEVRGDRPVVWATAPDAGAIELDRSPDDQHYPADGDFLLPFPLADAIRDVEAFSPLVAWRAAHPGSLLVSAWLRHGRVSNQGSDSEVWQLAYAEPSGAGHVVSAERVDRPLAPILIQDHGDITLGPFMEADLSTGPITIASATKFWHAINPESSNQTPDFIQWGFVLDWKTGAPCMGESYSPDRVYPATQLKSLTVGTYSGGSCVEPQRTLTTNVVSAQVDVPIFYGGTRQTVDWG